ncbi:MAG: 3-oxoacyl-[acyl-carrier-protein] synthase III C-terminal domain-containing protein, partial [Candidatus Eremiobacterota bacterium]
LMNRIPFRTDLKRLPIFGLGCLGGAAGVARVADYLQGHPDQAAVLLAVELCSLTLQRDDLSIPNIVSSGLFGDGAAAVLMVGGRHPLARAPRIQDTRSVFFPDSEEVMGWDICDSGFRVVLSPDVPRYAGQDMPRALTAFLAERGLAPGDIRHWVAHPGGPRVLLAMEEGLGLPPQALERSGRVMAEVGNLSSASVLAVLERTLAETRPEPGDRGLMLAMGPAFCAEVVLLRW